MTTFEVGDRVTDGQYEAVVIGVTESVRVQWDGTEVTGTWPASQFTKIVRAFDKGNFVRSIADDDTSDEVGIIFDDDGTDENSDPYNVALFDEDENEEWFSSNELIPWIPYVGDRVIEAVTGEEDEVGTVLSCDGFVAKVLWDDYPLSQEFKVTDLEPADEEGDDSEPVYSVGKTVIYNNPIFAGPIEATIIGFDDAGLRVRFTRDFLPEGNYSEEFFSKAA